MLNLIRLETYEDTQWHGAAILSFYQLNTIFIYRYYRNSLYHSS